MRPIEVTWTVQEAKARLSELLRRARDGTPQRIGAAGAPCVLLSEVEWQSLRKPTVHLGRWLVSHAPRAVDLELPSRAETRPSNPFERGR